MKALVITDFDSKGSGYRSICAPLFSELAKLDYEIKIVGLANLGEEHFYPFSIIPAGNLEEVKAIGGNLIALWNPDVLVVALDIPLQIAMYSHFAQSGKKYIAITPLENGPLVLDWAMAMFNMDAIFFISELGKIEAQKVGITKAEHLQIGVNLSQWRPAHPDEKKKIREGLGIPQDAFVILTVADNQERKNLWAGLRAIKHLKKEIDKPIRYILVTREDSPFGWRLRSLAVTEGVNEEYMCFERGMPQKDLWGLYAVSDVYLQPSKAEGLGLPVMDAMCCKIPVVATDTGALTELLEDGRGTLCRAEYTFTDVWGNEDRKMVSIEDITAALLFISQGLKEDATLSAYDYIIKRTWDIPASQLDKKIREICDVGK